MFIHDNEKYKIMAIIEENPKMEQFRETIESIDELRNSYFADFRACREIIIKLEKTEKDIEKKRTLKISYRETKQKHKDMIRELKSSAEKQGISLSLYHYRL